MVTGWKTLTHLQTQMWNSISSGETRNFCNVTWMLKCGISYNWICSLKTKNHLHLIEKFCEKYYCCLPCNAKTLMLKYQHISCNSKPSQISCNFLMQISCIYNFTIKQTGGFLQDTETWWKKAEKQTFLFKTFLSEQIENTFWVCFQWLTCWCFQQLAACS